MNKIIKQVYSEIKDENLSRVIESCLLFEDRIFLLNEKLKYINNGNTFSKERYKQLLTEFRKYCNDKWIIL